MKQVKVKEHKRISKKGNVEIVRQHLRNDLRNPKILKQENKEDKIVLQQPKRKPGTIDVEVIKLRNPKKEKVVISKNKVIPNPSLPENMEEKYSIKYPLTWKLMNQGKWEKVKDKKEKDKYHLKLSELQWKDLINEHKGLINSIAKKYSFGQDFGDRYDENHAVAIAGFLEGVNAYGKYFNPKKLFDFGKVIFSYTLGRVKESNAQRLSAGLRIPANLQKPYQQYLSTKRGFEKRNISNPTDEQIAKILQKVWTKKTFDSSYKTYDERRYDIEKTFVIGYEKIKGKKVKITEKRIIKGKFGDLDKIRQELEKKKDLIPLEGYVTIYQEGVTKNKETKHEENINKIEEDFNKRQNKLEEDYLLSKTMPKKDREFGINLISSKKKEVDNIKEIRTNFIIEKNNEQKKIEKQQEELINKIKVLKEKVDLGLSKYHKTKFNKVIKQSQELLKTISSDAYTNEKLLPYNKKITSLDKDLSTSEKEYEMVKNFYTPIDQIEYEKRKTQIEVSKKETLNSESHRYNNDTSSLTVPGIKDRIKEFQQIESIKNVPLNLTIEGDDGSGMQMEEKIKRPNELSNQQLSELIETHTVAKNILKDKINMLPLLYRDIFSLYIGLHEKSKMKEDNLWGELATNQDIIKYLDKGNKAYL